MVVTIHAIFVYVCFASFEAEFNRDNEFEFDYESIIILPCTYA